jgi:hypothetical protein
MREKGKGIKRGRRDICLVEAEAEAEAEAEGISPSLRSGWSTLFHASQGSISKILPQNTKGIWGWREPA